MSDFNVGIVGYGWVAGAHIAALNSIPGVKVRGVHSTRELDGKALSAAHGTTIDYYKNLDDMLADPAIHVVSICSYHASHPAQAIAAARAGKHLIIEKPLGLSWKDCQAIEKAVAEAGVFTCVCFECRYSSQFLATKSVIDQGLIGRIHYGEVDYYHGIGPWYGQYRWNIKKDMGGSSLLTAGCHALDALLLCMGGEVEEVSSYGTKSINHDFAPYEYDTSTVTILKFADGRAGKCASIVDCIQPYYFHVHLVGSEGSVLDNKLHSTRLGGLNKHKWSELSMKMLDSGDVSDHPYTTQFQAFFAALRERREMPLTSLKEAMRSHEVLFAADKSAETGRPVRMEEMRRG